MTPRPHSRSWWRGMSPTRSRLGRTAHRDSTPPSQKRYAPALIVVVVAGQLGCELLAVELFHRDGRRGGRDVDERLTAVVHDRVLGRGRDEDQIALADLLRVACHGHAPGAAHDHVDLLG